MKEAKATNPSARNQTRPKTNRLKSPPQVDDDIDNDQDATKPIAAVERALQVLSAFRTEPRLTLSQLANRTGLFKSTLLRILFTLERNGYVMRLADGHYRVGGIVCELGAGFASTFDLSEVIKPALTDLSRVTGETAAFYVRSGTQRQCVFREESSQPVRHVLNAGQIIDLDGAATSQLLRRYEADGQRPNMSTDYGSLCVSTSGVGDTQTASVAAPIFDTHGFVGVLNISAPISRFTPQATTSCLAVLALVARRVTMSLGGFQS